MSHVQTSEITDEPGGGNDKMTGQQRVEQVFSSNGVSQAHAVFDTGELWHSFY